MMRPLRSFAGFRRARGGNVAIMFALLALPMLGFTGAAIDYGLATRLSVKLQAATDATALALCQTPLATTQAKLQEQAGTMITGYMDKSASVDPLTITSSPRQITLTAHAPYAQLLGQVTGGGALVQLGATARCATPLPKTFEIALVLDNTGSMNSSGGEQTKMEALRTAATNFVDYVFKNDAFAKDTRISVVPFSASVALPANYRSASWIDLTGKSSYHWTNVLSPGTSNFTNRMQIFDKLKTVNAGWAWAGCLESLPYPLNVADGAPMPSNNDSYFVPLLAPDEPGNGAASYACVPKDNPKDGYNCSYNSYIDDATNASDCGSADGMIYRQRLGRACKYVSPKGAVASQSNYAGIPNGPNNSCTTQPMQTLSGDASALKTLIGNMVAVGSTNIHEGLMWGWRTLSPLSVFKTDTKPPAAYDASAVNKVMIVMTDGANTWPLNFNQAYNVSQYFPLGYLKNADQSSVTPRLPPANRNMVYVEDTRAALDALTAEGCANAKSGTNISVYTIGFSTPSDPIDDQGLNLLKNCASTPSQSFVANDSTQLIRAFDEIAKSIGKLRLTQ